MPKFRKLPVVIEGVQWDGTDKAFALIQSLNNLSRDIKTYGENNEKLCIHTLEGDMTANKGDWIIKGVKGELYPCKPDIFAETYEEVTD